MTRPPIDWLNVLVWATILAVVCVAAYALGIVVSWALELAGR